MATAKFDDGLPSNPKIIAAGPVACWLWFSGVLYCRRGLTDGKILRIVVPSLVIGLKAPMTHAAKLVEVGLWDKDGDDFQVHDFLVWNPSKAEIEGYRANDRERKQGRHAGKRPAAVPSGIPMEAERNPSPDAVTTHAQAKSASVYALVGSGEVSEPEESARETAPRDALGRVHSGGVAWGRPRQLPQDLHGGCFVAPDACARGWCIPVKLGARWVTQTSDDEVANFVRFVLANKPAGPIGDAFKFWGDQWDVMHAAPKATEATRRALGPSYHGWECPHEPPCLDRHLCQFAVAKAANQ